MRHRGRHRGLGRCRGGGGNSALGFGGASLSPPPVVSFSPKSGWCEGLLPPSPAPRPAPLTSLGSWVCALQVCTAPDSDDVRAVGRGGAALPPVPVAGVGAHTRGSGVYITLTGRAQVRGTHPQAP